MGGLLGDNDSGSTSGASTSYGSSVPMPEVQIPQFLPAVFQNFDPCTSEADLNTYKQALTEFKQVLRWTEGKFAAQRSAADVARQLTKSRNQTIAYLARTAIAQAKSDAELASILQAFPQMIEAIVGQISTKAEKKVSDFRARIENAANGGNQKSVSGSKTKTLLGAG
jgi:ABC-type transporter Mla subunit MlaD